MPTLRLADRNWQAAAERLLAELARASDGDEEGDGIADWALGDERLRQLVEGAEAAAAAPLEGGTTGGTVDAENGGWREMMEQDGWSEADLEAELQKEIAIDSDDDDEELAI